MCSCFMPSAKPRLQLAHTSQLSNPRPGETVRVVPDKQPVYHSSVYPPRAVEILLELCVSSVGSVFVEKNDGGSRGKTDRDRFIGKQIDRRADRQTSRKTDRQAEQADRQQRDKMAHSEKDTNTLRLDTEESQLFIAAFAYIALSASSVP